MSCPPPTYHGNTASSLAPGTETQGTFGLCRRESAHVRAGIQGFGNEDGAATTPLHFATCAAREAYVEGLAAGRGTLDGDAYGRFMRKHDNTWL